MKETSYDSDIMAMDFNTKKSINSDVDALCLDNNKVTLQSEAQNNRPRTQDNSETGKWTFLLLVAAFVCCFGSALPAGYNIGVMNNVELVLKKYLVKGISERYSINIDDTQLTYCWSSIISIFLIAGAMSSLVAGYLADHYGRKRALIIGNLFGILGGVSFLVIKFTNAIELFWLGRIFVGISGGLATSLVPLYMTEIAPLKLRGAVGVLCQLGITGGVLLSQLLSLNDVLGTDNSWNILLFAFVPICLIAAIITLKLPESPKYLYVIKGDHASARKELCRLRNKDMPLLQREFNYLDQEASSSASNETWTMIKVIKSHELRLPLILVCLLQFGQQLSGINAIFYYSGSIFRNTGLSDQGAQYATIGTGVANVVMALISAKLMSHFGRRKLFLTSSYSSIVCLILLFISIECTGNMFMQWIGIISMISYVITYGLGLGPIPYFIGSELFDVGPKPAAIALGSMCNWAGNFLVGMFFIVMVKYIGAFTFFIFVASMTLIALFVTKYLPETLGKTTTEVTKMMVNGFHSKYTA